MKEFFAVFAAFSVIGGLWFFGPDIYRFMGGRYEEARHSIYKESTAHVHGTIEHLNRLKLEYETATEPAHKAALRETILTSMGQTEPEQLPSHLRAFIYQLRGSI